MKGLAIAAAIGLGLWALSKSKVRAGTPTVVGSSPETVKTIVIGQPEAGIRAEVAQSIASGQPVTSEQIYAASLAGISTKELAEGRTAEQIRTEIVAAHRVEELIYGHVPYSMEEQGAMGGVLSTSDIAALEGHPWSEYQFAKTDAEVLGFAINHGLSTEAAWDTAKAAYLTNGASLIPLRWEYEYLYLRGLVSHFIERGWWKPPY